MTDYKEFFKIYPSYEEVFYDEIENHKKYFFPLFSINLKIIDEKENKWLHFISVKEIYEGCVGENTEQFHTKYTKLDMLGFDIIDGKYKFDSKWEYFSVATEILPENYHLKYSYQEIEYNMNEAMFQLKKSYYQKFGKIYDKRFNRPGIEVEDIRRVERLRKLTPDDLEKDESLDYLSERISKKIGGLLDEININKSLIEKSEFCGGNLLEIPKDDNNEELQYIGCTEGYDFQLHAADQIILFYDKKTSKAIICLEYT